MGWRTRSQHLMSQMGLAAHLPRVKTLAKPSLSFRTYHHVIGKKINIPRIIQVVYVELCTMHMYGHKKIIMGRQGYLQDQAKPWK